MIVILIVVVIVIVILVKVNESGDLGVVMGFIIVVGIIFENWDILIFNIVIKKKRYRFGEFVIVRYS